MYIRSASSPSTVLWAFHTIQPSSLTMFFGMYFLIFLISDSCTELLELRKAAPCRSDVEYKVDDLLYLHSIPSRAYALDSFVDFGTVYFVCLFTLFFFFSVFYLFFPLRIDPLYCQAGCHKRLLNLALVFCVYILCCSTFLLISECVLMLC